MLVKLIKFFHSKYCNRMNILVKVEKMSETMEPYNFIITSYLQTNV